MHALGVSPLHSAQAVSAIASGVTALALFWCGARLASRAAGFTALAPDLYHGAHATEPDDAVKLLMGLAMDQAAKDIAKTVLARLPR